MSSGPLIVLTVTIVLFIIINVVIVVINIKALIKNRRTIRHIVALNLIACGCLCCIALLCVLWYCIKITFYPSTRASPILNVSVAFWYFAKATLIFIHQARNYYVFRGGVSSVNAISSIEFTAGIALVVSTTLVGIALIFYSQSISQIYMICFIILHCIILCYLAHQFSYKASQIVSHHSKCPALDLHTLPQDTDFSTIYHEIDRAELVELWPFPAYDDNDSMHVYLLNASTKNTTMISVLIMSMLFVILSIVIHVLPLYLFVLSLDCMLSVVCLSLSFAFYESLYFYLCKSKLKCHFIWKVILQKMHLKQPEYRVLVDRKDSIYSVNIKENAFRTVDGDCVYLTERPLKDNDLIVDGYINTCWNSPGFKQLRSPSHEVLCIIKYYLNPSQYVRNDKTVYWLYGHVSPQTDESQKEYEF
eukprot:486118_1